MSEPARITTDLAGLWAEDITIASGSEKIPGYAARPALGSGPLPVVVVVHEIYGVHEYIKDVVRRLAKRGYVAVAPELFVRQGDVHAAANPEAARALAGQAPDAQVLADIDATFAWARSYGGDATRLALTGFCWGGRIAWLAAAHNPDLKAVVAWYGRLTGERTALQPRFPLDVAGELKAPVLGLYGAADQGIPLSTVGEMEQLLSARTDGPTSDIQVFADAPHAFFADYRPSYRPEAARAAWDRMLEWLTRHGVA